MKKSFLNPLFEGNWIHLAPEGKSKTSSSFLFAFSLVETFGDPW